MSPFPNECDIEGCLEFKQFAESSELRQGILFSLGDEIVKCPDSNTLWGSQVELVQAHPSHNPFRCEPLCPRTMRQMRDLRRYSVPVTINNPKQVNIAADGGQQVNVQGDAKAECRKRKRASNKAQPVLKAAK